MKKDVNGFDEKTEFDWDHVVIARILVSKLNTILHFGKGVLKHVGKIATHFVDSRKIQKPLRDLSTGPFEKNFSLQSTAQAKKK